MKLYSSHKSWYPQTSIDHLGSNASIWDPYSSWIPCVSFCEYSNEFKPSCKIAARNSSTTLVIVGLWIDLGSTHWRAISATFHKTSIWGFEVFTIGSKILSMFPAWRLDRTYSTHTHIICTFWCHLQKDSHKNVQQTFIIA